MSRAIRRRDRPMYRTTLFSLLAVMLVACAPTPLHRPTNAVARIICSTVDLAAPTPTMSVAYTRGTPGEGMIVPPPGRPMRVVATASGGGATLSIGVPDGPLLVGGAIGVEFVVRNDSRDPLQVHASAAYLQDEAGQELTLHGFVPGNWPGSFPPTEDPLILPSQSLDLLFNVQLPNADDLKGHAYHLVAQTRALSPAQQAPAGSGTSLLVTSPSIAFVQPKAAQRLNAELYPKKAGWCLQVLAGDGSRPTSPLTAEMWAQSTRVATDVPLSGGDQGVWVGIWPEPHRGDGPIHVQIWVASPDYVTAQLDQTVPGL